MRTAALLLLLALPQAKDKAQETPLPKEPIKGWEYKRRDVRHDVQTNKDILEVTAIIAGEEAVPVNADKKIFDLRGVTARYFTEPAPRKPSNEIVVMSERGRYDHEARTLQLDDRVRVVKKDEEKSMRADTVLHASHALLHFNRMYECPTCRKLPLPPPPQKAAGKCPTHGDAFKEVTITSVEVVGEFVLAGPEGILSGDGLVTDDAINREYHITRNGFIEFGGDVSAFQGDRKAAPAPAPAPAEASFSQIFSRGPLHITGPETERTIQGQDGMRVDRIDSTGTLTVSGREMTIVALRRVEAETQKLSAPDIRNVAARGKVEMEGVIFEDGSLFHTKSETLTRTLEPNPDPKKKTEIERIVLRSTEIPVFIETSPNEIQARTVTITREKGTSGGDSVFEEVLDSKLRVGDQKFALKCDRLTTHAEPTTTGRTDLRNLQAEGRVVLGGLMSDPAAAAKGDAGEARADFFVWDVLARRGRLEATPFVRITQGPSTITAPKVLLESPNIIVLKGPKQVNLLQEREGVKEEYRATCDGDLVLDQESRRLWMRDRCFIRTKDMLLKSDRVNALLTEDGKGLESLLALGRVHAVRGTDGTNIYGDRLAYRFKDQDLRVYGEPYAVADTGRSSARQEQIRVYEKKHPKTGQMIRYTEMIGGRDGVHIEITERPRK